jgi:hypothetical protein
MNAEQIIEYACREGFRVVVTETMVMDAIATLAQPFTCLDVVEAIPFDEKGCAVSEYLVALWIDDFVGRGRLRWTKSSRIAIGKRSQNLYEVVS